ncbi:hypothetical protein T45_02219 [Streptomyces turgidiscabies]|nr:hypothetical protein T45_02219 [Streptomyces turgidiscabies]
MVTALRKPLPAGNNLGQSEADHLREILGISVEKHPSKAGSEKLYIHIRGKAEQDFIRNQVERFCRCFIEAQIEPLTGIHPHFLHSSKMNPARLIQNAITIQP